MPGVANPGSVSKRVPFVLGTERDSNSTSNDLTITYGFEKREYCYEEGSFRGACFSVTKPADILVNVRRREFRLSAFRVSCLSCERLSRSAGPRGALVFEKDKPGSERNRGGCFRTLESRPETLGLSV
jgi:hypothetical protein